MCSHFVFFVGLLGCGSVYDGFKCAANCTSCETLGTAVQRLLLSLSYHRCTVEPSSNVERHRNQPLSKIQHVAQCQQVLNMSTIMCAAVHTDITDMNPPALVEDNRVHHIWFLPLVPIIRRQHADMEIVD